MTSVAVMFKIDGERVTEALAEAGRKLDAAEGEIILDFSSVRRVDARALGEMQALANASEAKQVKVVLRGVNVDVYKVLKLARLSPRFSFVT